MTGFASLAGKTALVTGASRGIGLAIAQGFAEAGAKLVLVGRNRETLDCAAAALPVESRVVVGPVEAVETAEAGVAAAIALGGGLDILVNNAGGPPPDGALVTMPIDDFEAAVALNLRAPLLWVREAWARSMRVRGGVVLNIASIGGLSAPRGMGAYATAKAGVLHMTRMLAAELGPKVRVNAIAPGVVRTDATAAVDYDAFARILPLGRIGEPRDIAAVARFLASDEGGWITGETIAIEGGTLVQTGRLRRGWDEERA